MPATYGLALIGVLLVVLVLVREAARRDKLRRETQRPTERFCLRLEDTTGLFIFLNGGVRDTRHDR